MKVSLKTAFSILDGRLSTEIDEVYEMLNYIFDANFFTHQLPSAMDTLKNTKPDWFKKAVATLEVLKSERNTNNFSELMDLLEHDNTEIELGKITITEKHT